MRVVHFQRKPFPGAFSLESVFDNVRRELPAHGIQAQHCQLPWFSKGILPRLRSILWAGRHEGDVNHIAGDVHFIAPGLTRERTILTICDLTILDYYDGIKRRLLKWFWYDWPLRHAAVVTVISEATKQLLLQSCQVADPQRVVVVPVPVASIFKPHEKQFHDECPRVLQIGTNRQKNIDRLAEALEGLHCHLHIIGRLSPTQAANLEARQIRYTTAHDLSAEEVYQAYCECDVVSFASTAEGFGMPIVEAQYVERPVVTSNCSSMPEVAGAGACLVDPLDVQSIRSGFERVFRDADYRRRLVDAGRLNRKRFAVETIAAQYADLYQQVYRESEAGANGSRIAG